MKSFKDLTTSLQLQIDETSKEKAQAYLDKAMGDFEHQNVGRRNTTGDQQKEFARKEALRRRGISRAVNRTTTEGVKMKNEEVNPMEQYLAAIEGNVDFRSAIDEKKLTPAELKKREEVAKAIERENPDMPLDKKMAIATATAKKVAEEVDLDESRGHKIIATALKRMATRKAVAAGEVKPGSSDAPFDNAKPAGEKKDEFGNVIKNRAQHLAKKGMASVKEEVEKLDESAEHKWWNTYKNNENINAHSENIVHLANLVGDDKDKKEAVDILKKHKEAGYLTPHLSDRRNALHKKLMPKVNKHFKMNEEADQPVSVTVHYKHKDGRTNSATHFTAKNAAEHEASVKKAGGTITGRTLNYASGKKEHRSMSEEVEQIDEMKHMGSYTQSHVMKKIKSGEWEATSDVKPNRHVELRHHSGKRITVKVEHDPVKEDVELVEGKKWSKLGYSSEHDYHKARYTHASGKKAPAGTSTMAMMVMADKAERESGKKLHEDVEQIDELSKTTLKSYVKNASTSLASNAMKAGNARDVNSSREPFAKAVKRMKGIEKAADKLAKEESDIQEAMLTYSEFKDKLDMHRKAGHKVVDDKYTHGKAATYTTIDKEGMGRKVTHTPSGTKMENLGKVSGEDDEASDVKQTEKRGRGRPAGSKSGARRH